MMKKTMFRWLLMCFTALFTVACGGNGILEKQSEFLFNDDWKFHLIGDTTQNSNLIYADVSFNDSSWESVTLPHTAVIEPYLVNDQWQGICWYRKNFNVTDSQLEGKVFLRLDGAMNVADLWVNGIHLTTHLGGYLPVVADMTDHLKAGDNIIAVRLDNYDNPITGPKPLPILDFNMYGGLYRNAWLVVKEKLYITDPILENKAASGGIFATYPYVGKDRADVNVKIHIRNDYSEEKTFTVENFINKNGKVVARSKSNKLTLIAGGDIQTSADLTVKNPALWAPHTPELYELVSRVTSDGKVVDVVKTTIGLRDVTFKNNDLYLNGEKTFLRGVNRHQEYPYIGYALSDNAQWRDAVKIKDGGFDYVRLSHYPPAPAFLEACDALGIFVLDAIPGWQYRNRNDPRFDDQVVRTVRDMIRRDRNHPSVLAWEVSLNETGMPNSLVDRFQAAAKEEYPGDRGYTAGWVEYGYDIYVEARQHRHGNDINIDKPYSVSEYGDWEYYAQNAGLNQDDWGDLKDEERSSRQTLEAGEKRLLQQALNIQEAHNDNFNTPAFSDSYWVMFDYNRGYADDLESSGVMSIERLSKFSYYFFQSQRDALKKDEAMVYIANYWSGNSPLDVRVFSNCDEVELSLNGNIIAKQTPDNDRLSANLPHPPFTFKVPGFEAGELKAVGYLNGEKAAEYVVRTAEEPQKLNVRIDESGVKAGENDVLFVYAEVQDKNGTIVHDAEGIVSFTLSDGSGAELVGESPAIVRAGTATMLVKTANKSTGITVNAQYGSMSGKATF